MTRIILKQIVEGPSEISLRGDEHHYLTRVRRHRKGDRVELRDARGTCFDAVVTRVETNVAVLAVERRIDDVSRVFPVTLAVAVPKRHLMDDVVRKLSEIGVAQLIPLVCDRSVVHPGAEKVARWRRIASESMRQCGRGTELTIQEPAPLVDAMPRMGTGGTRLILHPKDTPRCFPSPGATDAPPPISVIIGPEGGFTDDELRSATTSGFEAVKLMMPILRIETAAIVCAALSVTLLVDP